LPPAAIRIAAHTPGLYLAWCAAAVILPIAASRLFDRTAKVVFDVDVDHADTD
jgi:hypothetical protein